VRLSHSIKDYLLTYLHYRLTRIVISSDPEFYGGRPAGCGKMWGLHVCSNNVRRGASYRSLWSTNRMRRIEWCHLPAHSRRARNRVRNPSNSALSIASNGSHVALSQHLLSFLLKRHATLAISQNSVDCCNIEHTRWRLLQFYLFNYDS